MLGKKVDCSMKMESDSDLLFTDANCNVSLKVGTVKRCWMAMAHSILAGKRKSSKEQNNRIKSLGG